MRKKKVRMGGEVHDRQLVPFWQFSGEQAEVSVSWLKRNRQKDIELRILTYREKKVPSSNGYRP